MPVRGVVDQIHPDYVTGWAADVDGDPTALDVELWIDGSVYAQGKADGYRADLKRFHDGRCAYRIAFPPITDFIAAVAHRGLSVFAVGGSGQRYPLMLSHHFLGNDIIRSVERLFGSRGITRVAEDMRHFAQTVTLAPYRALYMAQLCDFLRLFFPAHERPTAYYEIARELSALAGREAAARYYQSVLDGTAPAPEGYEHPEQDPPLEYGNFADLAGPSMDDLIDAEAAAFISGGPQAGFLQSSGPAEAASGEGRRKTVWFPLQGFGDTHWRCEGFNAQVHAPLQFYLADFDHIRRNAEAGGVLVIDMSAEGPPAHGQWVRMMNAAIADFGLSVSQVMLINQNFTFTQREEGPSLQARFTPGQFYLLRGVGELAKLFPDDAAIARYITETLGQRHASADLRKFSCLNFTPRWPRWAMALSLFGAGLIPDGYFSFPGLRGSKASVAGPIEQILPGLANKARMIEVFDAFVASCPYIVDTDGRFGPAPDFVFPEEVARNSLLHIVTETEMSNDIVVRVTEKVLKPIVALQPFVIVGNPHSLRIMRKMGFQTFGDLIDESYDEVLGTIERFDRLEAVLHGFLKQDTATIAAAVRRIEGVCVFNFLHLMKVWPQLIGKAMQARIAREIVGA